ncbi:MAG: LysE family translocator [Nitrososphaerales archaeon]
MGLLEFPATQEYINFFLGMALGFSLAAPPGPANALIAYFSTNHSRLSGFLAGMGASSADAIILVLIFFTGFASILTDLAGKNLFLASGIVMLVFAAIIFKGFNKVQAVSKYSRFRSSVSYFAGLVTNISSPYTITWWITVGTALVTTLGLAIFGFFTALMIWNISFPSTLAYSKKRLPQIQKYVSIFALITLSAFGIWFVTKYVFN